MVHEDNTSAPFNKNTNRAFELVNKTFLHEELISMLESGNDTEKQFAALSLASINTKQDAQILVSNLVGQDGKIREAVSFTINRFINDDKCYDFFLCSGIYDTFLLSVTDINGNVCRNMMNVFEKLKENTSFCEYFCPSLCKLTLSLISKIKHFKFEDGKYKVNKEVFKLYWCLATLYIFAEQTDIAELKNIVMQTAVIDEYTIREKTAKILSKNFNDSNLRELQEKLKSDKNYYVRMH